MTDYIEEARIEAAKRARKATAHYDKKESRNIKYTIKPCVSKSELRYGNVDIIDDEQYLACIDNFGLDLNYLVYCANKWIEQEKAKETK